MLCIGSTGGNICPFPYTFFARDPSLCHYVHKRNSVFIQGGKKKEEEKDVIGWSVWIVRGPKLPLTLRDEPTPKLVVGCQG